MQAGVAPMARGERFVEGMGPNCVSIRVSRSIETFQMSLVVSGERVGRGRVWAREVGSVAPDGADFGSREQGTEAVAID